MTLETVVSIGMLGGFIWVVRFLLPKAINEHDPMALTCAVLTALLALLGWLLIGVGTRSLSDSHSTTRGAIGVRFPGISVAGKSWVAFGNSVSGA